MNSVSPFDAMQAAVDVVNTSPHPANKIAATLFGSDRAGNAYTLSHTNFWPPAIAARLGTETRIGNSSGTIHAETACVLAAPYTQGASLCVTDPFCPNCAKNMAEAGIRAVYIDHKGFDKDFAARRGGDFTNMSMQICERAGMSVYEIRRKEGKIVPILETPDGFVAALENPLDVAAVSGADETFFKALVHEKTDIYKGRNFALAIATDELGKAYMLAGTAHHTPGYREDGPGDGKYTFIVEPVNRLLMNAARHGLRIADGFFYSAHVPTSREQVNLSGAGISRVHIGDVTQARDEQALQALAFMREKGVLEIL